jgi:ATP phosphoribosyltransferase
MRLRIGVGKGRASEHICDLLQENGFDIPSDFRSGRRLVIDDDKSGIVLALARNSDLPKLLHDRHVDVAISSNAWFLEFDSDQLSCMHELDFGYCRLSLLCRESDRLRPIRSICTRFTHLAQKLMPQADVVQLNGSNEIALLLGFSDAVLDVVETGATMAAMQLVERQEVAQFRHCIWTRADCQHHFSRFAEHVPMLQGPDRV